MNASITSEPAASSPGLHNSLFYLNSLLFAGVEFTQEAGDEVDLPFPALQGEHLVQGSTISFE